MGHNRPPVDDRPRCLRALETEEGAVLRIANARLSMRCF